MKIRGELTIKQRRIAAGAFLFAAVLVYGLVFFHVGMPLVKYISDPEAFRAWVGQKGAAGMMIFVAIVALQVVVALIPGEPFEVAAGYAFGPWVGTLLCLAGTLIGSIIVFALVRRFGMGFVKIFFSEEQVESHRFLKHSRNRDLLFFIIYALPGTPKDILSYLAGLTDMKFGLWLMMCTLGRIPSVAGSAFGGSAIGDGRYKIAFAAMGATLVISLAGIWIYRRFKENKDKN